MQSTIQQILPTQPTAFDYFIQNFWFIYLVTMIVTVFLIALASEESPVTLLMNEITKLLGSESKGRKLFGLACVAMLPVLPFTTFIIFIAATLTGLEVKILSEDKGD